MTRAHWQVATAAALVGIAGLLSACSSGLPSRNDLQKAFEDQGVQFKERTLRDNKKALSSTNQAGGSTVEIVADPPESVLVSLEGVTPNSIDSSGHFPGSALIDVVDSKVAPGVKGWFVEQIKSQPTGIWEVKKEISGLIAEASSLGSGFVFLVVKTKAAAASPTTT